MISLGAKMNANSAAKTPLYSTKEEEDNSGR